MAETKTLERICKALGSDRRLHIVQMLKGGNHETVSDVARAIARTVASASKHLSVMRMMGNTLPVS